MPPGLRAEGALVHACKSMQLPVTEILGLLRNDTSSQAVLSLEMYRFSPRVFLDRNVWGEKRKANTKPKHAQPALPSRQSVGASSRGAECF